MTTPKTKTPPRDELATVDETPESPLGFDALDLVFGFPLAATLAHVFLGGGAAALAPVSLPAVVLPLIVFVGQKALRTSPHHFWRAVDFTLALFPDERGPDGAPPTNAAKRLIGAARDAVYERAAYEEIEAEEGVFTEEAAPVPPGSTPVPSGKPTASPATTATLPMIDLATLARCSTILLVGSRGSGKSTLLRALLSARRDAVMVYDPHAAPSDWPMATMVHNSETSIAAGLLSAYVRLQKRKDERRKGIRLQDWPGFTLAADEWGSIVADVVLPKKLDVTPGSISLSLMKEGRKFNIGFVAGAHGKTNKSLGCEGDNEAFLNSFDWIINLGAFTRSMLKREYAELLSEIPMGTNEQGGTFPLIVVCESPTTGELRLLDMRGLDQGVNHFAPPVAPPTRQSSPAPSENHLLASLLDEHALGNSAGNLLPDHGNELPPVTNGVTACSSGVTELPDEELPPLTPAETALITRLLVTGNTVSQVAKKLPGYSPRNYQAMKAKVEAVQKMLDTETGKDTAASTDDDDPDVGPFGSLLGK